MKVLLTGATGFVGREVLRQLVAEGHLVRVLVRHSSAAANQNLFPAAVEIQAGDVTKPDSLAQALQGIEAVVHLVGIISEVGAVTFENVHVRGTQNLLQASRSAGTRRFVHMSALGTRPQARSRYHQTKWIAEEAVRASGLEFSIFRPSIIFGPHDHFVNLFAALAKFSPVLPVIGTGQTRFAPVAVASVARAFTRALSVPASVGQTFDLCGPDVLTFDQMLDEILRVQHRRRLKLHLPLGVARAQAGFFEWFFPVLLRRAPPLNRDQLLMLQEDNVGRGEPANSLFQLSPVRFREGIAAYLA